MQDCIFCKISTGEIPSDKIYEDEQVFAFLDIRPVNKGHALVVPKKHAKDFLEVDAATLTETVTRVQKIAKAVMKATGAGGFNLHVNTGSAAGQVVFHLHFHIIPRFEGDGIKMWPYSEVAPKTRQEMASEIKKFI